MGRAETLRLPLDRDVAHGFLNNEIKVGLQLLQNRARLHARHPFDLRQLHQVQRTVERLRKTG